MRSDQLVESIPAPLPARHADGAVDPGGCPIEGRRGLADALGVTGLGGEVAALMRKLKLFLPVSPDITSIHWPVPVHLLEASAGAWGHQAPGP